MKFGNKLNLFEEQYTKNQNLKRMKEISFTLEKGFHSKICISIGEIR